MRLFNFVFCLTIIVVLYFTLLESKESKSENSTNENVEIIESVTNMFEDELSDIDTIKEYEDEIYRMISNFSKLFESLDNELFYGLDIEE